MHASRTDPGNPWVQFALASLERTEGSPPALLSNLGGGLPNDVFTDQLGLPTIWIRTPTRPARSTPPMSTSSPRSPARPCASWRACSGIWASTRALARARPRRTL